MAQVRGTFAALYDNVDKVVTAILRDSLEELPAIWKKTFSIKSSDRKFERVQTVTPFGDVPEKPEGNIYSMDLIRAGYSKDFTHTEFGMGFEVTETALEDDQFDQLQRSAEWLAFSARYVEERYAANILNNGFTTETTPDAVSLFNTAHVLKGGGTAANRPSTEADLSATSLAAALSSLQTETKLESGQLVAPIQEFQLIVPPALEFLAENRLILANPAARQVFGVTVHHGERPGLGSTIPVKALLELLQSAPSERRSAEISMPDGKTYLATTSAMTAEGRTVGRICILRDVAQLKEIDTLKSDFVSTVSHDLRSPLTLMRGYATMLQMAGDLNDQQKNYVRMIVTGVDNMSKLVSNLLDLGRIDFGVGLQVESVPVLDLLERVTNSLQIG